MLRRLTALILLAGLALSGCRYYSPSANTPGATHAAPATQIDRRVTDGGAAFGLTLLKELRKADPAKNIFLSPASVSLILSLTLNGAQGPTRDGMLSALQLKGLSAEEVNAANQALQTVLANPDPKVQLSVSNSIWYRQGLTLKAGLAETAKTHYGAAIKALDFDKADSPKQINQWVQKQTNKKIDGVIDGEIPQDAVMYLINAIYFNGTWKKPFDPKQTREASFTRADGTSKQHPLMHMNDRMRYYADDRFQAVALPYGEGRISLYVLLPAKETGLDGLIGHLTPERWADLMTRMPAREGILELPKVKLEYKTELNAAMKALGMAQALTPSQADFSGLFEGHGKDLYISKILHKSFLDLNERGTEAAAVTSVEVRLTSAPADGPFRMTVDLPFLMAIRDDQTGALLFVGAITDP